ncbi:MAG: type III-B CRISPR module RAMP protein Cmr6 [Clostridia bacterium]|nr:type III-B CRISPR module RAMP protein Cmr6 [Clostridia bacterium]
MRDRIRGVWKAGRDGRGPGHLGLAYGAWAPVEPGTGKVSLDGKGAKAARDGWTHSGWLSAVASIQIAKDYVHFYDLWRASLRPPRDGMLVLETRSRLLVGHGEPSATDVGLAVHHTWGAPVIPGSAVKGLLAHYVEVVYGPEDARTPAWRRDDPEDRERARYLGPAWRGARIERGPGDRYRALFGAPDADDDEEARRHGLRAGAEKGGVVFHDALYVPEARVEGRAARRCDQPFVVDVLTVHQFPYYSEGGGEWPNDFDSPNPVSFVTVRPGCQFLFSWSTDDPELAELVAYLLPRALAEWGVGGKTSLGYGRFGPPGSWRPPDAGRATAVGASAREGAAPRGQGARAEGRGQSPGPGGRVPSHRRGERITVTRVEDPRGRDRLRFQADDRILGQILDGDVPEVPVGGTLEVWVANVSPDLYTFTVKDPRRKK